MFACLLSLLFPFLFLSISLSHWFFVLPLLVPLFGLPFLYSIISGTITTTLTPHHGVHQLGTF